MRLCDALGISRGETVAFVGAGGKSSTIRVTAGELAGSGLKVIVLPTTKMTVAQADSVGPVVLSTDGRQRASQAETELESGGPVVVGSELTSKERIDGVPPDEVSLLCKVADVVLIEADGARGKSVKGTADHEPVLPEETDLVVAVAGIGALGKPVTEEFVHRPELFSVQTGVGPGQSITARAIARSLKDGSLANLPEETRPAVLLTGVTPGPQMSAAAVIARELWRFGIKKVVFTSLTVEENFHVWMP
ncbi:selenium cofactor biosynthesis protein YqeC [Rubrobacter indicoceani]|uniref:selenium cofactor biosynthesis protein YqeC n=1 Tax=Rubrobacter indicoceani TaxID=2051957 RepID=UPI0013C4F8D6|nr:selenium cofactor biosynthesis protein YqeC [Rubrobacter indicoceani]